MNHDVLDFSNAIIGGTVSPQDVVARAAERIQSWFRRSNRQQMARDPNVRGEERRKERARVARELDDTLRQGFLGASPRLHTAVAQMPTDSPEKPSLNRGPSSTQRALDEGRPAILGPHSSGIAPETLEQALSGLRDELTAGSLPFRIFVSGKSRALKPAIQEQVFLIGREAVVNALRHSRASSIEVEIQYLPRQLRVVVRDNGCGIDPQFVRSERDGHWGLLGMHERAGSIGARLRMWSKPGCGTEVQICVPADTVETLA